MRHRIAALVFLIVVGLVSGTAAAAAWDDLLPRPQQVEPAAGEFTFDWREIGFVLRTPDKDAADRINNHIGEVAERLRLFRGARIDESPVADTWALLVFSGDKTPQPVAADIPAAAAGEGYALRVSPEGIAVAAKSEKGLFYGLMTVEQLFNSARAEGKNLLPCGRIVDWPAIAMRGFHEDYGRDQLPTMEDHKRTIRILSQFKMNTHLWFIEPNHFVYAFDPALGQDFDRFTFDEIREVVAYAKKYYVEVIPVVELLAHMEWTLTLPQYQQYAEVAGGGTLCPTSEESFELVRKMVNEIAPAFESRYFHCGLDESQQVGEGKSAEAVKQLGYEKVYADYYSRLNDLVKSHGKQMVMYADIVLNHPKVMDMLPKDIVMMYWEYSDAEHHAGLDALQQGGFEVMSLSGLHDWVNAYPLYDYAFRNIERLGAQSAKAGVSGYFVSSWGDWNLGAAGANLSELNYYGVVYTGHIGWNPVALSFDAYSPAFARQFFGVGSNELDQALTLLAKCQSERRGAHQLAHSSPKDQVPAMGQADEALVALWKKVKDDAGAAHKLIRKTRAANNAAYLLSHDLAARILEYAGDLALQYRATAVAMKQPDFNAAKEADAYEAFADRQAELWEEYEERYSATNRPINLRYLVKAWDESIDALLGFAEALRRGEGAAWLAKP